MRGEVAGEQTVAEGMGLDQAQFLYSFEHFFLGGGYSFWRAVAL